jgi:hypothetical protein
MALFKKRKMLVGNVSFADYVHAANKNLRGAAQLIGPLLDPDERLINFYTQGGPNNPEHYYIFLTSKALRVAKPPEYDVQTFQHDALAGIRFVGGYIRFTYIFGGTGNVYFPTFHLYGGYQEHLALYGQLCAAWTKHMGTEIPEHIRDGSLVPRLPSGDPADDAPTESEVMDAIAHMLSSRDHSSELEK